jgi:hypothetical protein
LKIRDSAEDDIIVRSEIRRTSDSGDSIDRYLRKGAPMPINVAQIVTKNVALLKDLSLEEVLEVHPLLNAQGFTYGVGRKVKPIWARPINSILDKAETAHNIWEKLLLGTIEGQEALKRDCFICWGEADDVWQQKADKLHDKYTPVRTDVDGWTLYKPKPDVDMNVCKVSSSAETLGECGGFSIVNPWWGDERLVDAAVLQAAGIDPAACGLKPGQQVKLYLHYGVEGDRVLQNQKDNVDTYVVADSFYRSTYEDQ